MNEIYRLNLNYNYISSNNYWFEHLLLASFITDGNWIRDVSSDRMNLLSLQNAYCSCMLFQGRDVLQPEQDVKVFVHECKAKCITLM